MYELFWHHGSNLRATPRLDQPTQIGRPCQTLRHGYRNTLRFFGFDDVGSVDLQIWMVEARDVDLWGARVEDTRWVSNQVLSSHFIMRKTILVDYFIIGFIGG